MNKFYSIKYLGTDRKDHYTFGDAWCNAFVTTMQEHVGYASEKLRMLEGINDNWYSFHVIKDIRNVLTPKKDWISAI